MLSVSVISEESLPHWFERMGRMAQDAYMYWESGVTNWFVVQSKEKPIVSRRMRGAFKGEGIVAYDCCLEDRQPTMLLGGTMGAWRSLLSRFPDEKQWQEVATMVGRTLRYPVNVRPVTHLGDRHVYWGERTYVMGILNVTPDSFSDGGQHLSVEDALAGAEQMLRDGADIIDVGGESTRPGSDGVSVDEELRRVIPVIEGIVQDLGGIVSIDTQKAAVAEAAVKAGASMVNDITGLLGDARMAEVCASLNVPVVLMHIQGRPKNMQDNPTYTSVVPEVYFGLKQSIDRALTAGIRPENIIVDPGFGFGKNLEHNLELLRRLHQLRTLGYPILVGTSRKSMIGAVLNTPVDERLEGTGATIAQAIAQYADIVRVHDVKAMSRTTMMSDAVVRGHWRRK